MLRRKSVVLLAALLSATLDPQAQDLRRPIRAEEAGPGKPSPAWSRKADMPARLGWSGATVLDDVVYVVGGHHWETGQPARDVGFLGAYDPSRDRWRTLAPMRMPRNTPAVGAIDGKLYVAGGWSGSGVTGVLEAYDPISNRWEPRAPMPTPRTCAGAVIGGVLYAVGGAAGGSCTSAVEAYDPRTDSWRRRASMRTPRCSSVVAVHDGKIYVMGGVDTGGRVYSSVEAYDSRSDSWTDLPSLPTPRTEGVAAGMGGRVYLIGGRSSPGAQGSSPAVESYDPAARSWAIHAPMPALRHGMVAAAVRGILYVAGGRGATEGPRQDTVALPLTEAYDPLQDRILREVRTLAPPPGKPIPQAQAEPPQPQAQRSDLDEVADRGRRRKTDFAVVMGVERYRSEIPRAEFAERDARTFGRYASKVLGVPEENVILLVGDKATRADLARYVEEWLARNVEKDSRVYFYFAGHGAPDPAKGSAFLLPWDGDPSFLETSAYPLKSLYARLEALPAKEIVVMLDACFSGRGGRSVIGQGLRPLVTAVRMPEAGSKLTILTATANDEVAGSGMDLGHGLFTYFLLKGMGGAAARGRDGSLEVQDLYRYVHDNVRRAAARQNREQTPQWHSHRRSLRLY